MMKIFLCCQASLCIIQPTGSYYAIKRYKKQNLGRLGAIIWKWNEMNSWSWISYGAKSAWGCKPCQVEFGFSQWKKYLTGDLPPPVFMSLCLLSAMSWTSQLYHILPAITFCLTVSSPRSNRNQVTLSLWKCKGRLGFPLWFSQQKKVIHVTLLNIKTKTAQVVHVQPKNKAMCFLCPVSFIYLFRFVPGFLSITLWAKLCLLISLYTS